MYLQSVIPVPIFIPSHRHSGNSASMTEHEVKVLAGFIIAFIALTLLLDLIVFIVAMIKYDVEVLSVIEDSFILFIMNVISGFIIFIGFIAWVGSYISKLL